MRRTWAAAVTAAVVLESALAPAEDDLRPPLVGMTEHFDAEKGVSIELPVNWKDEGAENVFGSVQRWSGFFGQPNPTGPDAWIYVRDVTAFARVELARWGVDPGLPGTLEPDSVRRDAGLIEEVRKEDARERCYLIRWVEHEGHVLELTAYADRTVFPHIDRHLRRVMDTFKVLKPREWAKPPAGYTVTTTPATEVWTDTKDKKTLKRITDLHATACAAMAKLLPGERAIAAPMRVAVCDKDADFSAFAALATGNTAPSTSFVGFQQRLFVARVAGKASAMFDHSAVEFAAAQFMQYYFGGKPPDWIDRGLSVWAVTYADTKGGPEKAPPGFVKGAKAAVAARGEDFAAAVDLRRERVPSTELEGADMAWYAWNCFFVFGTGQKTYGGRYVKYLDTLRTTGSPEEAKKAFDGVDLAAMTKEFRAWVAAWK